MSAEQVVELGRRTLEMTLLLSAPVLITTIVVSLVVNVFQVLTSVQDATIATVPKLIAAGAACFLALPWMLQRLVAFTLQVMTDFRPYLH